MRLLEVSMKTNSMRQFIRKPIAIIIFNCALVTTYHGAEYEQSAIETGNKFEDFFTAALEYNPGLRIAEERLNIGLNRKRAANGQLLPQLSANANVTDNRRDSGGNVEEFDGERYSLRLTQILFDWRAFSARKQAYLAEDQLEAEYFYELSVLLTEVAESYFNVLQARDELESVESELEAVSNQLEQVSALYELQLVQVTDLSQARASVASTQAAQIRLRAELSLAKEALRSITGIEVGQLEKLLENANVPSLEHSVQYYLQQAKENNQQIQARESALEVAEEVISERKGAYMPQVTFIAQRQDSNVGFDNAPINEIENTFVGVDVSIPLYAGGSNRARVGEARSQRNIAESELRQVELEAGERVRSAFLQTQASESFIEAATILVESTAINAMAMQEGFELGTVTNVDVLNAIRDQFAAERDLQRARYEQIRFLLLLKRETGTLTPEDMLEVGRWLE